MANINSVGAVTQAQGQQSVNQQANKAAEAAAKAKKEREAIIDKAPTLELKQCALMSTLFSSDYLYGHHYKNQDGKLWSNRIIGFLGGGKSNPAEVNNYFTCDNKIKFYYDGGTVQAGFFKDLYYTFLDADGKAKEIRLKQSSLSTSDAIFNLTEKLSLALNDYVSRGSPPGLGIPVTGYGTFANAQDLRRAIRTANAKKEEENLAFGDVAAPTAAQKTTHDNYNLQNIKIEYDGTNPSTARSDVKVTLTFYLESFVALKKSMLFEGSTFNDGSRNDFLLRDLIIAGIGDDSRGGALTALKKIYSPSSNRLRIKVKPKIHNGVEQQPMVLDLAIVDHELARDASKHGVTLTINYRGYMQQLLQMPYANALMTTDILNKRRSRHSNISKLIGAQCSQATLREILRVERSTSELEMRGSFSHILDTLFKYGSIKSWKLEDDFTYAKVTKDLFTHGKNGVVQIQHSGQLGELNSDQDTIDNERAALESVAEEGLEEASKGNMTSSTDDTVRAANQEEAWFEWMDGNRTWSNCVFFGDLIHAITDVLYEPGSDDTIPEIKEKLKFVFFPIHLPDPTSSGSFIEINPSIIPIDLYFFAEWWHEVVVKKQLKHYPISAMMRDLTERLVNNLLYELCVSNLLPDETPPMLRVSSFTSNLDLGSKTKFKSHTNSEVAFFLDYDKLSKPIFPQKYDLGATNLRDLEDTHYIVMYIMNPPYRRELRTAKNNKELRNSKFVPTLTHGIYSKAAKSHIDTANLKKTNSPGLREARYFNNSFGSLAIMNNVYDLSFTIAENNPSTYLYPGMIINFILTDFGPKTNGTRIDNMNYKNTENDPHKRDTDAFTLGMGGYFIIKRVSYELQTATDEKDSERFIFNCDAKFLSTEADEMIDQGKSSVISIIKSDKNQQCRTSYDEAVKENRAAVDEHNQGLKDEDKIDYDWDTLANTPDPATNQNPSSVTNASPPPPNGRSLPSAQTPAKQTPQNSTQDTPLNLDNFGELLGTANSPISGINFDSAKSGETAIVSITDGTETRTYTFSSDGDEVTYKETPNASAEASYSLQSGESFPAAKK